MGRNNSDFHGIVFSHVEKPYGELTINAHHPEHGHVGKMELSQKYSSGYREIKDIIVDPEHRRKGIATGLWNYAKAQGFNPEHSDSRTPEGDAWAESTGDYVPDNNQMYNPDAPNVWGE